MDYFLLAIVSLIVFYKHVSNCKAWKFEVDEAELRKENDKEVDELGLKESSIRIALPEPELKAIKFKGEKDTKKNTKKSKRKLK